MRPGPVEPDVIWGQPDSTGSTQIHLGTVRFTWEHSYSAGHSQINLGASILTWAQPDSPASTHHRQIHLGISRFTCVYSCSPGHSQIHWPHPGSQANAPSDAPVLTFQSQLPDAPGQESFSSSHTAQVAQPPCSWPGWGTQGCASPGCLSLHKSPVSLLILSAFCRQEFRTQEGYLRVTEAWTPAAWLLSPHPDHPHRV